MAILSSSSHLTPAHFTGTGKYDSREDCRHSYTQLLNHESKYEIELILLKSRQEVELSSS
jgi:hypothetical protein